MKKFGIVTVLLVIGVGIFLMIKKSPSHTGHESDPAENTTSGAKPGSPQSSTGSQMKPTAFYEGAASEKIPWKKMALAGTPGNQQLYFKLEARGWCGFGDLDLMKIDNQYSENKNFTLSIEPLSADSKMEPIQKNFRLDEVERGISFAVPIPELGSVGQLGLFICRSSKTPIRCQSEAPIDFNKVMQAEIQSKGRAMASTASLDRIYYFQYLFIEKNQGLLSFDNPMVNEKAFTAVENYLERSGEKSTGQKESVQNAQRFTAALRSLPLEYEGNTIRLVLPMKGGDEKNCKPPQAPGENK